jgi:hypothetical protein
LIQELLPVLNGLEKLMTAGVQFRVLQPYINDLLSYPIIFKVLTDSELYGRWGSTSQPSIPAVRNSVYPLDLISGCRTQIQLLAI